MTHEYNRTDHLETFGPDKDAYVNPDHVVMHDFSTLIDSKRVNTSPNNYSHLLQKFKPKSSFSQATIEASKKFSVDFQKLDPALFVLTQNSDLSFRVCEQGGPIHVVTVKDLEELKLLLVPYQTQKCVCLVLDMESGPPSRTDIEKFVEQNNNRTQIILLGLAPQEELATAYTEKYKFNECLTNLDLPELKRI